MDTLIGRIASARSIADIHGEQQYIFDHLEVEAAIASSIYSCVELMKGSTFTSPSGADLEAFENLFHTKKNLLSLYHTTEERIYSSIFRSPDLHYDVKAVHALEFALLRDLHHLHRIIWESKPMSKEDCSEFTDMLERNLPWKKDDRQKSRHGYMYNDEEINDKKELCRHPETFHLITLKISNLRVYIDIKIRELQARGGNSEMTGGNHFTQSKAFLQMQATYEQLISKHTLEIPRPSINAPRYQPDDHCINQLCREQRGRLKTTLEEQVREAKPLIIAAEKDNMEIHKLRSSQQAMKEKMVAALAQHHSQKMSSATQTRAAPERKSSHTQTPTVAQQLSSSSQTPAAKTSTKQEISSNSNRDNDVMLMQEEELFGDASPLPNFSRKKFSIYTKTKMAIDKEKKALIQVKKLQASQIKQIENAFQEFEKDKKVVDKKEQEVKLAEEKLEKMRKAKEEKARAAAAKELMTRVEGAKKYVLTTASAPRDQTNVDFSRSIAVVARGSTTLKIDNAVHTQLMKRIDRSLSHDSPLRPFLPRTPSLQQASQPPTNTSEDEVSLLAMAAPITESLQQTSPVRFPVSKPDWGKIRKDERKKARAGKPAAISPVKVRKSPVRTPPRPKFVSKHGNRNLFPPGATNSDYGREVNGGFRELQAGAVRGESSEPVSGGDEGQSKVAFGIPDVSGGGGDDEEKTEIGGNTSERGHEEAAKTLDPSTTSIQSILTIEQRKQTPYFSSNVDILSDIDTQSDVDVQINVQLVTAPTAQPAAENGTYPALESVMQPVDQSCTPDTEDITNPGICSSPAQQTFSPVDSSENQDSTDPDVQATRSHSSHVHFTEPLDHGSLKKGKRKRVKNAIKKSKGGEKSSK